MAARAGSFGNSFLTKVNPAGTALVYSTSLIFRNDSDGNGVMDDLDHDGRITIADSRVVQQAVDRVEQAHPELVGGAGVYPAAAGHGPFIHIDTRGYRARWVGGPGGG